MQKSAFLWLMLLAFSSTAQAQKMDVIDYHKAFVDNLASPNNQLLSKYAPKWVEESGKFYLDNTVKRRELIVNSDKTYLSYKDHEGWQGTQCYPTFKIYTKADGNQILAVT